MKIAFGTIDGDRINDDHFGQSPIFVVLELNGSEIVGREIRKNPYGGSHIHAKVDEILEVLGDCKVWVGRSMGKGSMKKLVDMGYEPVLTKAETVNEAFSDVLNKLSESL